jgi:hypothetical protein
MSQNRLTDKFKSPQLRPTVDEADKALVALVQTLGATGSIYSVLQHIVEHSEDIWTILVDDHSVVRFEIPRRNGPALLQHAQVWTFREYRERIGQGKARIKLDRAAKDARDALDRAQKR